MEIFWRRTLTDMVMLDELRSLLLSNGANMVGIADLHGIAPDVRDGFPIGISIAVALHPQIIFKIKNGPTKQYFAEYERANNLLDMLGPTAARFLNEHGFNTKWLPKASRNYETGTLSSPLPHKTTATRAGLGWIGKCALLVTRTLGSAVRITTVLTDASLPTGKPVDNHLCGRCTFCVDACPGHAPSGKNWRLDFSRADFFDAFTCQKTARLAAERIGVSETICGICIAVCPWTQKYIRKSI